MPSDTARIPFSSHVLLLAFMALFLSVCLDITLQAALLWWLIPLAALAVVVVLAAQKYSDYSARRREAQNAATAIPAASKR